MRIDPFGDSALLITFDREISELVNQEVISLYKRLQRIDGFQYLIPAYNSLTIGLDLKQWNFERASAAVRSEYERVPKTPKVSAKETYTIPVCYESPLEMDLDDVSRQTGLSKNEIIDLHTNQTYRVYMLGFVAGFAYMGSLPESLNCKRKETPRLKVPKGSVGLAGLQTGIYPTEAPGGWQIIGQTPLEMFDLHRSDTSLLKPGDCVKFRAISFEEFRIIRLKIETGIFEMEEADV
mgnify:CR=1 FL=1